MKIALRTLYMLYTAPEFRPPGIRSSRTAVIKMERCAVLMSSLMNVVLAKMAMMAVHTSVCYVSSPVKCGR